MKLRRRSTTTTGGPGTGTILAVAGLTLSWLISPSSSLFSYSNSICFGVLRHRSCRCHRHGHRQSQRIVIVEARPLSTTTFHRALSIREDERGEEMELTSSVAAANSHENTMLLDTMMDSAENAAPADDCEIYSDGYNDDNGIPLELTSPMTSSSKSSSVLSNNELEEMNSGVLNSKSDSESSGGSKKEQRPSNRRMQVFAYLSKPGEWLMFITRHTYYYTIPSKFNISILHIQTTKQFQYQYMTTQQTQPFMKKWNECMYILFIYV